MDMEVVSALPVHDGVPVVCNAVLPLSQITGHGQTNLKARQGKALQHHHLAISIHDLSIAGGEGT